MTFFAILAVWHPLYISEKDEDRYFIFSTQLDHVK